MSHHASVRQSTGDTNEDDQAEGSYFAVRHAIMAIMGAAQNAKHVQGGSQQGGTAASGPERV
eukprot:9628931-Alexandrium_andersonii.AAC.1